MALTESIARSFPLWCPDLGAFAVSEPARRNDGSTILTLVSFVSACSPIHTRERV